MANPAVAPLASLPPTRSRGSSEIDPKPAAQRDRAGVSIGTSTTDPPSRVQRESSTHPHVPCERRTDPAEPTQTRSAAGSGRSERRNVHHLPPPRAFSAKTQLIPTFPANAGPVPRSPPKPAAQRDRAGASVGTSTTYSPRAFSAKAQLIPTFPASAGPVPRSPPKPAAQRDRAGASIGTSTTYPPRAFSAKAQPHPPGPCERRTDPAEPTQTRQAQRDRAGASVGTSTTYPPSRVQRESPTSSPRSLRTQDRSRGAHPQTHPPMLAF